MTRGGLRGQRAVLDELSGGKISSASVSNNFVLKQRPDDFLVRENMVVELSTRVDAPHHYATLRKCGFTTMEAVRLVADEIDVASREVTYGGLKDEDGITEQLIAAPRGSFPPEVVGSGWSVRQDAERWIQVSHYGFGQAPLAIGALEGNGFHVVVRNLGEHVAERTSRLRKLNLLFVNYYDTQRFGVPGGAKRTHLVGGAILEGDWDRALSELAGLGAPESPWARQWTGTAKDFFRTRLDSRTTSFYLASQSSHQWNARLRMLLKEMDMSSGIEVDVEGIQYRYATSMDATARLLVEVRDLPITKYGFSDGEITTADSHRPSVVQSVVTLGAVAPDALNPGRYQVRLSFSLPSGCYATTAIRQLFTYLEHS